MYEVDIKNARMLVVRDALNGGTLELVGPTGQVLHVEDLGNPSGAVADGALVMSGFPKSRAALVASSYATPVTTARFKRSNGNLVRSALAVGLKASAAPAWTGSTVYAVGDTRTNGLNQYRVVSQTGPSAATGGPAGTGNAIADGGVVWAWVASASAPIKLSSMVWAAGDTITIEANPTIVHGA